MMGTVTVGRVATVVAIAFPLALAVGLSVVRLRAVLLRLAPWGALPALALALGLPLGEPVELPWVLIDAAFSADDALTHGFLTATAAVWLACGWFARAYLADDPQAVRFWFFFLSSMAGNIGLVLARDVVGFYALFALMTFAAYGVIVHEQTGASRRAAQVYFVLAFAGELLLLVAFFLTSRGDTSASIDAARTAVATSPHPNLLGALLLFGFGVKAGLVPVHCWLPLAHPVAPTPASAVLSGAMIQAGLLGWLRFLPLGSVGLEVVGWLFAILGCIGAVAGALIGAAQRDAKTVLAYSSVSQMGILAMVVGVLVASPEVAAPALPAIAFFALHHALAKGALFLGTAVAQEAGRRWARRLVTLGLLVSGLSIAGAPLSSGALGKVGLHMIVEDAAAVWHPFGPLLSVAAVGSSLIMIRFLTCAAPRTRPGRDAPRPGLWIPWSALVVLDLLIVFGAPVETPDLAKLIDPAELWSAGWPVLVAAGIAAMAWFASRRTDRSATVPAGDVLVLAEVVGVRLRTGARAIGARIHGIRARVAGAAAGAVRRDIPERAARGVERAQLALGRYEVIGALLAILLLVVLVGSMADAWLRSGW